MTGINKTVYLSAIIRNKGLKVGGVFTAALLAGFFALAPQAQADMTCGKRNEVIGALDKGYHEKPVSMGLASNGDMIEVFASKTGSWTMIMSKPDGKTCLVASGEHWQDIPKRNTGLKI